MRYFGRLMVYIAIFWVTFSVSYVLALTIIPVTITPLKFLKLAENSANYGIRIDSKWCSLDKINNSAAEAVVASEDNNFMLHSGFDWQAINKAIEYNKRNTNKMRGASTITQQTAKNVFCTPNRTWVRKGFESYYTFLVELIWSKQRIMEVYLNVIETHPNVYGVKATANRFYKKEPIQLNAYESSMIACVLPNPQRMNIGRPSAYMNSRAANIRSNMAKLSPESKEISPNKKMHVIDDIFNLKN